MSRHALGDGCKFLRIGFEAFLIHDLREKSQMRRRKDIRRRQGGVTDRNDENKNEDKVQHWLRLVEQCDSHTERSAGELDRQMGRREHDRRRSCVEYSHLRQVLERCSRLIQSFHFQLIL
eukprot:745778-Hanusia_phi.AAC.1